LITKSKKRFFFEKGSWQATLK